MENINTIIKTKSEKLLTDLTKLLTNYSKIYRENPPNSGILRMGGDYVWKELPVEGKQLQAKIYEAYNKFFSVLTVLLKEQPPANIKRIKSANKLILDTIKQDTNFLQPSIESHIASMNEQFNLLSQSIENLFGDSTGKPIFIPDTNALLHNPDIAKWSFASIDHFLIALTPTILSELDKFKISHKNQEVKKKAKKIINTLKEYQRRGKLTEGVTVVKNKIDLFSIAIEPDFINTLPWLDTKNADDRFIASSIEIMRKHPNSPICILTLDINLQNKCEFADLPFDEPPHTDNQN